jgi:hypothetical protein
MGWGKADWVQFGLAALVCVVLPVVALVLHLRA